MMKNFLDDNNGISAAKKDRLRACVTAMRCDNAAGLISEFVSICREGLTAFFKGGSDTFKALQQNLWVPGGSSNLPS